MGFNSTLPSRDKSRTESRLSVRTTLAADPVRPWPRSLASGLAVSFTTGICIPITNLLGVQWRTCNRHRRIESDASFCPRMNLPGKMVVGTPKPPRIFARWFPRQSHTEYCYMSKASHTMNTLVLCLSTRLVQKSLQFGAPPPCYIFAVRTSRDPPTALSNSPTHAVEAATPFERIWPDVCQSLNEFGPHYPASFPGTQLFRARRRKESHHSHRTNTGHFLEVAPRITRYSSIEEVMILRWSLNRLFQKKRAGVDHIG